MCEQFLERLAARRDERVGTYVEAKNAYEAYVNALGVRFDEMTEEHYRRARADPSLAAARRGYARAIEMSDASDALDDAAVARCQLAMLCHACGELDEAAELMQSALDVLCNLPHRDRAADMSLCHYHLGIIALKQGRLDEAVGRLRLSRQFDESNSDLSGMRMCELALDKCAEAGADIEAESPYVPDVEDWDVPEAETPDEPDEEAGPRFEGKPPRVGVDRRVVIWLASYSVQANDDLMAHLDSLADEFGRPVTVSRVAFGSRDPAQRRLHKPDPDQHLCAAIVVLERNRLGDPDLREFIRICTQRVLAVPDFRLFVYLADMAMDELRDLSDTDPVIEMLFETTQVSRIPSLEQLRRTLVPYVRRIDRIRAAAFWRPLRLRLASLAGKLATAICLAAVPVALLGYYAWLTKSQLAWLGPYGPHLASLTMGLLAFPLQAPLLFLLLRGLRTMAFAPKDNALLMRWVVVGMVIMMGAGHLHKALDGPTRREMIDVMSLCRQADNPGMAPPEMTVLRGDPLNPYTCPLLPSLSARVFISYTQSSAKGIRLARALYRTLKDAGASPFLDRASIPAGASWRRALNEHIGECDTFVCILDERSVQRQWVAAEFLAALESRRLTGTPDVVVLVSPTVERPSQPMLPVFRGVVAAAATPPVRGRPQILRLNKQTPSCLPWALAPPRFISTAVLTRIPTRLVLRVLTPLALIGGLGLLTGLILGFLAMLEKSAKLPFAAFLTDHGLLAAVTLVTAYWLGFVARGTIAWEFEHTGEREMSATMPAIATGGLALALLVLILNVPALIAGWSVALAFAGWLVVAAAMRMGAGKPLRR